MTQAPIGWSEVTLGCLTRSDSPICYGVLKPGDPDPKGVPMVRVTDIRTNEFDSSRVAYITPELDAEFSRSRVIPGDVLVSVQGTVGRVAIVPASFSTGNISRTIARVRPTDPTLSRWIQIALLAPEQQAKIDADTGGTTRDSLNIGDLREITIPLAPASEQRLIIAKIDSLTKKSKRARDHLDQVRKLVERYRSAVVGAAFRGDLTSSWRAMQALSRPTMRSLGEVVTEIRYGTAQKCESKKGGTAVLRIPNISSGSLNLSDLKYAHFEAREYDKLRLIEGDVLVIRSNGSPELVGRAAMVSNQASGMTYAGYLIRLRANRAIIDPKFMTYLLGSPQVREVIEVGARSTSGVHNINSAELASLMLPIPAVAEQLETVRRIEAAFAWIDRLGAEASSARKLIDRLDQSVLSKAFHGELVPQDPDDEPASVLLERIKAEKVGAVPSRRGRGRPRLATAT